MTIEGINTNTIEDYVKAIYKLQEQFGKVSTTALAEHLEIKPASVTGMLKKLAELKLIQYVPYQPIQLSDAGTKIALEVIRHHRLIETFLAEALGVPWDEVHDEAEKWEHVISEDIEDRMAEMLGHPVVDPHGDPIPNRDGSMIERNLVGLHEVAAGDHVEVAQVSDHDPEMLRYIGEVGLYPGTAIEIIRVEPFDGPITLKLNQEEKVIGYNVANFIQVVKHKEVLT